MSLEPEFGGETTRLQRLSKWAVDVEMPPLSYPSAMKWFARLTKGDVTPLALKLPQPEVALAADGALVVDGAGQAGTTLNVRGGVAGYPLGEGRWLSLMVAARSRSYLYMVDDDVSIDVAGKAAIKLSLPIRHRPADGDALTVEEPVIWGLTEINPGWSVESFFETGVRFTLTEVE